MKSSDPIQNQSAAQLATALRRSVVRLARRIRAKHPSGSVTPARLSVLRWLHHQGTMTAGQIAAADSLQPQSVTRLLTALEQDGLILRHVDENDRRRTVVDITQAGLKVLRADAAHRDEWLLQAMKTKLTPDEYAVLTQASALLEKLADESSP